jgi:serpin B
MHSESHHFYFEDKKIQILEIPYLGDDFCFTIILPKKNNTLLSYSSSELTTYLDKAKKTSLVELSLPKFKMEADYSVKNDLEALGIHTAFSPSANFEGIAKNQNLCIDEVIHKTFIEIDEVGTIAAAVTEVEMSVAADADSFEQPKKVIFNVNHPFLFAIRHKITGTNLFLGVINQL